MKASSTALFVPRRPALSLALAAALPGLFGSTLAYADCTGSVSAPQSNTLSILCNNSGAGAAGAQVVASDGSTYVDARTDRVTANHILLQFDGHGRSLTVNEAGVVANYRNVAGSRTAVTMGAPTQNASASTTFGSSPSAGASQLVTTATPSASWVGQSIVLGRWSPADGGDFLTGESYVITAVNTATKTLTLDRALQSSFAGTGDASLPVVYSVVSNYGAGTTRSWTGLAADLFGASAFYNNTIANAGLIASRVQSGELSTTATSVAAPYNSTIYGIRTSVAGNYLVDNQPGGRIAVTHAGIGAAYAVEEGGTVLRMDINNAGTIEAVRTPAVTLTAVTASGNPLGSSSGLVYSPTSVGLVNAINTQEEAEVLNLLNTGTIRTQGDYTGTLYMRAGEKNIVNTGTIVHLATAGGSDYSKGFAIGSVSNGGEIRELNLDNKAGGTIRGDILAVNGNALRWYLLSTAGTTDSGNTLGSAAAITDGRDARLLINSHTGQENSEIANAGTITGNVWLANGRHELANSGTLTGNIDVDQRDTRYGTASGTTDVMLKREDGTDSNNSVRGGETTIRGDKSFEFTNTGTMTGRIVITNATSLLPGSGSVSSTNSLVNAGTLTGDIAFANVTAGSRNSVTLQGDGFNGSISVSKASGEGALQAQTAVLNLKGTGTLRGDVAGFTQLNVGVTQAAGAGAGDDDDLPAAGRPNWSIAAGRSVQADAVRILEGQLAVQGTLRGAVTVASGTTLAGSGTVVGPVDSSGVIDTGSATLNVSGDVTLHSGSVLRSTVGADGAGKLAVSGALGFDSGAKASLLASSGYRIRDGAQFTIATASSFSGLPATAGSENGLLRWRYAVEGNALKATAVVGTANVANLSGNASRTLDTALGAGGALADRLLALNDEDAVLRAAKELKPDARGSAAVGALGASNAVSGVVGGRSSAVTVASLLKQQGVSGVSTGDEADGSGLWFQGFGFTGKQQARGGEDGYGVNSGGFALGADRLLDAPTGMRIGAAFSYASTQVGTTTGIASYQATVYGSREFDSVYLSGELGVGKHDYTSRRPVLGEIAQASFGGTQYGGKLEAGMPLATAAGVIVPMASLAASRLELDGYTERGATGALSVDASKVDSLRSGVGGKWLLPLGAADSGSSMELRALWLHEFGDARFDTTARFAAGGSSFKTTGVEQERDSLGLGGSLKWGKTSGSVRQSLSLGYAAEAKRGYLSHTAFVQGRVDF